MPAWKGKQNKTGKLGDIPNFWTLYWNIFNVSYEPKAHSNMMLKWRVGLFLSSNRNEPKDFHDELHLLIIKSSDNSEKPCFIVKIFYFKKYK